MKLPLPATTVIAFIRAHHWFTLFMVGSFLLNLFLTLHRSNTSEAYITCSTFDRGPLGTYGLFSTLANGNLPVKRIELPLFKVLDHNRDKCKTLVILSPVFPPQPWEWNIIMQWVAQGNRLVTSGLFGPEKNSWFAPSNSSLSITTMAPAPTNILLPVDSVFPYHPPLAPHPTLSSFGPSGSKLYKSSNTVTVRYFNHFSPDMLPFLSHGNRVTGVKKFIGQGEWVIFTEKNPFGNTMLRDTSWFSFATRFFTGNGTYEQHPVLFDEYHNGYRATRGLWQLLSYFQFHTGIIYLSILLLCYLFITGIRITNPVTLRVPLHRDPIPGLQALTGLLIKYGAWKSVLKTEAHLIIQELRRLYPANTDPDYLFRRYASRRKLPPGIKQATDLTIIFTTVEQHPEKISNKECTRIFNLLMAMRKEMNL